MIACPNFICRAVWKQYGDRSICDEETWNDQKIPTKTFIGTLQLTVGIFYSIALLRRTRSTLCKNIPPKNLILTQTVRAYAPRRKTLGGDQEAYYITALS